MTENTQTNQNELNIQDLALARAVIELATERGTFKANEIASVGALYNKLDAFLKEVEAQAKAAKNGPTITFTRGDGIPQELTLEQVVGILQQQQTQINHLTNLLKGKDEEIKLLTDILNNNQTSINI